MQTLESKKPMWRDVLEIIGTALMIYLLINLFFITSKVNQTSMYPTFEDGDFIVATRGYLSGNEYQRGDVVLFDNDGRILIKRVIGIPGDKLEIIDGKVYINMQEIKEEYLEEDMTTSPELSTIIHDDSYFVMGDNRWNSIDSRVIGEIKSSQILGKVKLRLFPNPGMF